MSESLNQGFPNIPAAFVDEGRFITVPWRRLLVSLWNRTGGTDDLISKLAPPGSLMIWAGTDLPLRTLECNGQAVSRSTYGALYRAIGTTWGAGDGSTTFNVPDYQGKMVIGADGSSYILGVSGGSATTTIATANLPAHNHTVTDPGHTHTFTGTAHNHSVTDPGHTHVYGGTGAGAGFGPVAALGGAPTVSTQSAMTGISIDNATAGGTNASNTTGVTTDNTGSGTPVSTISPYAAARVLIRT